jgi:hypothetical protein
MRTDSSGTGRRTDNTKTAVNRRSFVLHCSRDPDNQFLENDEECRYHFGSAASFWLLFDTVANALALLLHRKTIIIGSCCTQTEGNSAHLFLCFKGIVDLNVFVGTKICT